MSTHRRPSQRPAVRARWTRTNGDLLVGGPDSGYYGPGINPSETPPVIWWLGRDVADGGPIGPNGPWANGYGHALPVVIRATSLIVSPLTAAPFKVTDALTAGRLLPRPTWVRDPMLARPDARILEAPIYPAVSTLTRSGFWSDWVRSALWWGVGAFICQPDETGQPTAGTLRLVHPHAISTERVDGSLRWVLSPDGPAEEKAVFSRDGYLTLGAATYRIVVLRNPHSPIDSEGRSMGVFEMAPEAFKVAGQVSTYTSGVFRTGVPAGYLKAQTPGLTKEQADELKARWLAAHGGDRRSIGVLNSTTDFVQLSLSPIDTALDQVKRLAIADVAYAFALDPEVLGVSLSGSATYKNAQEYWTRHRDFGLSAWSAAVEDTLTALQPGTQTVKVDLDQFSTPTLAERVETGAKATAAGLMTVDEWRAMEGLPPILEVNG